MRVIPIGISFFTFEAISCFYDVYKNKIDQVVTFSEVFLYLTFFPTVTSGPIVRIEDVKEGLKTLLNSITSNKGVQQAAIGLCKKVLADFYFNGMAAGKHYSTVGLWIGSITDSLQLYFDFSGYSDMAIGIGKIVGFNIPENFNRPYRSQSIQEFWRRWHISLSSWFRDYVYIPLGGNRCTSIKHIKNLLIVWLLTGLWHEPDWTFVRKIFTVYNKY